MDDGPQLQRHLTWITPAAVLAQSAGDRVLDPGHAAHRVGDIVVARGEHRHRALEHQPVQLRVFERRLPIGQRQRPDLGDRVRLPRYRLVQPHHRLGFAPAQFADQAAHVAEQAIYSPAAYPDLGAEPSDTQGRRAFVVQQSRGRPQQLLAGLGSVFAWPSHG